MVAPFEMLLVTPTPPLPPPELAPPILTLAELDVEPSLPTEPTTYEITKQDNGRRDR